MIQFCSCIIPYVFEDTPLRIRIGGDSDHSMDGPYFALDLTLDQPYYEWMDDNRTPEPIKDKVVSILKEAFEHPIDAVVDLLVYLQKVYTKDSIGIRTNNFYFSVYSCLSELATIQQMNQYNYRYLQQYMIDKSIEDNFLFVYHPTLKDVMLNPNLSSYKNKMIDLFY